MKYFVSSDIHGFYDEWMTALNNAKFDKNNPEHKIIVCGDLFDRGRQPKEIINFINDMGDKIILIKGNHEDLMMEAIKRNKFLGHDISNGTAYTLIDLNPMLYMDENISLQSIAKQSGLTNIIKKCYDYYETEHYVFVHGWIPLNYADENIYNSTLQNAKYKKNWRKATKKEWERARWTSCVAAYKQQLFEPNKIIVCGHWHCSALWHLKYPNKYSEFGDSENFEPFKDSNIYAIDGCTAHTHKVNVVIIEDKEIK